MAHIFISYSRQDEDYALQLVDDLRQRGFDVWIDQSGLEPSDHWFREIGRAVRRCAAFVIVKSPNSEASPWVTKEILVALDADKPIFPLLLVPCAFDLLVDVQHEDVTSGRLPPERFYRQLARRVPVRSTSGENVAPTASQARRSVQPPPRDSEPAPAPARPARGRSWLVGMGRGRDVYRGGCYRAAACV